MILPEIVLGSGDKEKSRQLGLWRKKGLLRPLLPRVYTSNFEDSDEVIVARNLWPLLSYLFPGTLLSYRSAIDFRPSVLDNLYLTASSPRVIRWPGITLRFSEGPPRLPDDNPLFGEFYAASLERATLENLRRSRTVEGESRAIDQAVLEQRLLQILDIQGENGLNEFRDRAKEIADSFGWEKTYKKLHKIIGALLSSHPATILKAPQAVAHGLGRPYDGARLLLFQTLKINLLSQPFPQLAERTASINSYQNFAFFESYFSNFIEGTVFTVNEAQKIIFDQEAIPNRRGDSHDIGGTFKICGDRSALEKAYNNFDEFVVLIRNWHATIMVGRPDKNPGQFKELANRAGSTFFVEPHKVLGSLEQAFELAKGIQNAFARAIFWKFALSEIHPFTDGNGRLARIMMNAELSRAGQSKIIIPTVYRSDYLLNLRQLTRKNDAGPYIRMMYRIWQYSHWLQADDLSAMEAQLQGSNAFLDDNEGAIIFPPHI